MSNRISGIIMLTLCWSLLPLSAFAQNDANIFLHPPDLQAFPLIQAFLDIHNAEGEFIHGITEDDVSIIEDGKPLPISKIEEIRPGVQLVVAINPGPSFGVRNSQAISRYDFIKESLRTWSMGRQGSSIDDMTLLITDGPAISHTSKPDDWLETLNSEQIDSRAAVPNLDTLFRGISLALDPTPRPGMSRAVLYITPPPEGNFDPAMENLSAQINNQDVPVFIWLVTSPGSYASKPVEQLQNLSEQTGGKFFIFTGEESLPDPEEYFQHLRDIYQIDFQSEINQGGIHEMSAQIQLGSQKFPSNIQTFEIDIQPPLPAFVSPPLQIHRKLDAVENGAIAENSAIDYLSPDEETLQIVIDFPDGRLRSLVKSSLYVDGQVVTENQQPPFERFTWNLNPYQQDGIYNLQVQVEDIYGLTGASIEIPVQISIEQTLSNPLFSLQEKMPVLIAILVLLAGALFFLFLVFAGRLRPAALRAAMNRRAPNFEVKPYFIDSELSSNRLSGWVNRIQWTQRQGAPKADAFLNPISTEDDQTDIPPIPITSDDIQIGSDPLKADLVLDDPCIETLHARLSRRVDGTYRLADEGSTAGSWINYTPVTQEGAILQHGDLIHIGRLGFRFTLRQPMPIRKRIITLRTSSKDSEQSAP